MTHKIGDIVYIKKNKNIKKIEFIEIIDLEEIYYMTDNTSYHLSQIEKVDNKNFIEFISNSSYLINEIETDWIKTISKKSIKYFT